MRYFTNNRRQRNTATHCSQEGISVGSLNAAKLRAGIKYSVKFVGRSK